MIFHTCSLLSRIFNASSRRSVITAAVKEIQGTCAAPYRITDPYTPSHDANDLNHIYTYPPDLTALLNDNLPYELQKQINIFREFGILIRKPAVEIISYLEQTDYTKPVNRYVLYGRQGGGKTTTLIHLLHYGFAKQFIVLYLPWVCTWFRFPKEIEESPLVPGQFDLPTHASAWLAYFKRLNQTALSNYDLRISKEYTWTEKELTQSGTSLLDLIDYGIGRNKFACGVIDALIDELKIASTAGRCKTLVVIDGFNSFTSNYTQIRDDHHAHVPPERISITSAFLNSVNYNWCNGAIILTVDVRATKDRRESDYPMYLLGKRGFEILDPFLPICVENYSTKEFQIILDYYKERKWIRNISEQGQRELQLLTNKNPGELWTCCKPL